MIFSFRSSRLWQCSLYLTSDFLVIVADSLRYIMFIINPVKRLCSHVWFSSIKHDPIDNKTRTVTTISNIWNHYDHDINMAPFYQSNILIRLKSILAIFWKSHNGIKPPRIKINWKVPVAIFKSLSRQTQNFKYYQNRGKLILME